MEGQGTYTLPPSLETKYVGEMKDGMWVSLSSTHFQVWCGTSWRWSVVRLRKIEPVLTGHASSTDRMLVLIDSSITVVSPTSTSRFLTSSNQIACSIWNPDVTWIPEANSEPRQIGVSLAKRPVNTLTMVTVVIKITRANHFVNHPGSTEKAHCISQMAPNMWEVGTRGLPWMWVSPKAYKIAVVKWHHSRPDWNVLVTAGPLYVCRWPGIWCWALGLLWWVRQEILHRDLPWSQTCRFVLHGSRDYPPSPYPGFWRFLVLGELGPNLQVAGDEACLGSASPLVGHDFSPSSLRVRDLWNPGYPIPLSQKVLSRIPCPPIPKGSLQDTLSPYPKRFSPGYPVPLSQKVLSRIPCPPIPKGSLQDTLSPYPKRFSPGYPVPLSQKVLSRVPWKDFVSKCAWGTYCQYIIFL